MASNLSIAVGQGGNSIATSNDLGLTWTGVGTSSFTTSGYGVAGPATYDVSMASVGTWFATGTNRSIATSLDPRYNNNWKGDSITTIGTQLNDLVYVNNLWVAVGVAGSFPNNNGIATSTDGTTWTGRNTNSCYSVAYGNGLWIACHSSNPNTFSTSTDGITWTNRTGTRITSGSPRIAFANGVWVIVGGEGLSGNGNAISTSTDGINWTGLGTTIFYNTAKCIAYGNGLWVACGQGGNTFATSTDGITWIGHGASIASNGINDVAFGNGVFVAVGPFQNGNTVLTSTNGITWTGRGTTFSSSGTRVAYGNGLWVSVGTSGSSSEIRYSDNNGATWNLVGTTTLAWRNKTVFIF